uniref:Omega-conotoxin-like PuIIA n=1 Tax=Conus pulicarius TaxID=93154 RepID=O162A_CONPL|nr:RecName: Full=Omega-conotoxin-like PuIIA; Flags: Precursor [Conus pulicarius]AAD33586.1 conotoxin PuIIA precursor [Conus pulicarius]
MKLTCVVIVAVLFLTACQLITAETYSRGEQKHRALSSTDKNSKLTRTCNTPTQYCTLHRHCCSLYCHKTIHACA